MVDSIEPKVEQTRSVPIPKLLLSDKNARESKEKQRVGAPGSKREPVSDLFVSELGRIYFSYD